MLVELYIFFEIIVIGLFIASFFTRNEILWVITLVTAAMVMFDSYNIQQTVYVFNESISAYSTQTLSFSYPWLFALNMIFVGLALLLGIYDLWDKYVLKSDLVKNDKDEDLLP